jgi:hypothetical protein
MPVPPAFTVAPRFFVLHRRRERRLCRKKRRARLRQPVPSFSPGSQDPRSKGGHRRRCRFLTAFTGTGIPENAASHPTFHHPAVSRSRPGRRGGRPLWRRKAVMASGSRAGFRGRTRRSGRRRTGRGFACALHIDFDAEAPGSFVLHTPSPVRLSNLSAA